LSENSFCLMFRAASAFVKFKVDPFVKTQNGASLGWNFLLSD
jgi:hypothetical protein